MLLGWVTGRKTKAQYNIIKMRQKQWAFSVMAFCCFNKLQGKKPTVKKKNIKPLLYPVFVYFEVILPCSCHTGALNRVFSISLGSGKGGSFMWFMLQENTDGQHMGIKENCLNPARLQWAPQYAPERKDGLPMTSAFQPSSSSPRTQSREKTARTNIMQVLLW